MGRVSLDWECWNVAGYAHSWPRGGVGGVVQVVYQIRGERAVWVIGSRLSGRSLDSDAGRYVEYIHVGSFPSPWTRRSDNTNE